MSDELLGEVAYNAYCESRGWKSVRGEPLPHWKQQDEALRVAWAKAARAVADSIRNATSQG